MNPREAQEFFRVAAKNSTAHRTRKTALVLAQATFSTNPQHSSQQQAVRWSILKKK